MRHVFVLLFRVSEKPGRTRQMQYTEKLRLVGCARWYGCKR
jgi:hypothetical protein